MGVGGENDNLYLPSIALQQHPNNFGLLSLEASPAHHTTHTRSPANTGKASVIPQLPPCSLLFSGALAKFLSKHVAVYLAKMRWPL